MAASAVLAASPNTFSAANLYAVALVLLFFPFSFVVKDVFFALRTQGAGALFFTFMNRGMMSGLEKSQVRSFFTNWTLIVT